MNKQKISMVSKIIIEKELGAIIFFRPDELMMTLGYRPYWGLSVAVCYEHSNPILYVPALEPKLRLPKDIVVKRYPWGETSEDPFEILYEMIKEDIKEYGNYSKPVSLIKNVGNTTPCILSAEQPPLPSDFVENLMKVSKGGYKNVDEEILDLYNFKTCEDIEGIRLCNKVAGIGIKAFYDSLQEGLTEAEVSAKMEYAVRTQIGKNGVKYASGFAQVQSGINGADGGRYNWVTDKKLENGDLVMTEFAVVVNGYWADITRTGKVGIPSKEDIRLHEAVKKAQDKALSLVREGAISEDLQKAASEVLDTECVGKYFTHGLGHGVGFRYHDPGIRIAKGNKEVLKEGMVITIEPGIYDSSFGGIRIEENVLVTKNGYEILSKFTRELKGD
ncbi:peptidase M24 [Vallitalea longa]|uniref:Peptidase M24 n=1 Tax=Vallitalea longa TaxID=2936439 RepID=A0A9W5Y7Q2_9FIRM|nr:Xaa-Pro peptidase family protein [Vallitalea longa]GKX28092.1 peptidase M24 [Vallitalea longa]